MVKRGFAQEVVASDPLPPSAALPLYQGETVTVFFGKGDSREAAGGRLHTISIFLPKAVKRIGGVCLFGIYLASYLAV